MRRIKFFIVFAMAALDLVILARRVGTNELMPNT